MGLCLILANRRAGGPASNLSMDFYYDCRPRGLGREAWPVIYVHRIVILIPE